MSYRLEKESGFFFNTKYFDEKVLAGEWGEVENYLSGFTKVDDNRYSMKIFFEIRKQKYLEALDRYEITYHAYVFYYSIWWFQTVISSHVSSTGKRKQKQLRYWCRTSESSPLSTRIFTKKLLNF